MLNNSESALKFIEEKLSNVDPFVFVRFSDGETEIIRNNRLEISNSITHFRGNKIRNNFPTYDSKAFHPTIHQEFRKMLFDTISYNPNYYIGIPTSHNLAKHDRNMYIRLISNQTENLTFADLFVNENHESFIKLIRDNIHKYPNSFVIANFRAIPLDFLEKTELISIPDNSITDLKLIDNVKAKLYELPKKSLVLSSASSLSNIFGYYVLKNRPDIVFLDIGTSLHTFLSLKNKSRKYVKRSNNLSSFLKYFTRHRGKMKW